MFFTLFGYLVCRGRSPHGLVHNLLMQFFTLGHPPFGYGGGGGAPISSGSLGGGGGGVSEGGGFAMRREGLRGEYA